MSAKTAAKITKSAQVCSQNLHIPDSKCLRGVGHAGMPWGKQLRLHKNAEKIKCTYAWVSSMVQTGRITLKNL